MQKNSSIKIIVFTPFKLRHRYFISFLLTNNIEIECIVIKSNQKNMTKILKDYLSISKFLDLLLTFFEFLIVRNIYGLKVNKVKIRQYADLVEVTIIKPEKLNAIVVYGGAVIPEIVLKNFNVPFLNVHGAILPGYRGLDSHWWMMIEKNFVLQGYTIHEVNSGIDSGRILKTKSFRSKTFSIERFITWRLWIAKNSAKDLVDILNNYKSIRSFDHNLKLSTYRSVLSLRNLFRLIISNSNFSKNVNTKGELDN